MSLVKILTWKHDISKIVIFVEPDSKRIKNLLICVYYVTSKGSHSRYTKSKLDVCEILINFNSTINHCFQIEQLIKQKYYKGNVISKTEAIEGFGWTETLKDIDVTPLINKITELSNDELHTTNIFKEHFNLNYAKNF